MPRISQDLRDALRRAGISEAAINSVASEQTPELLTPLGSSIAGAPAPGAPAPTPQQRQEADYLVGELVRVLRNQPGIPTRPPPQVAPTFYAKPFSYVCVCDISSAVAGGSEPDRVFGVRWNPFLSGSTGLVGNVAQDNDLGQISLLERTAEDFPTGYAGFVTRAECFVGAIATYTAGNPARQFRWTLRKNGQPIDGFLNTVPTCDAASTFPLAPTGTTLMFLRPNNPTPCFVPVFGGDKLLLEFTYLAAPPSAITFAVVAIVEGYKIPLQGDGRTPGQFVQID